MNTITKQLGCQTRHQENKTEWKTCLLAEGEGVTRGVHRTSHTDNTSHYTNLREYFPFNFPFQFWSHKKKNLGHKVQTHMWQIVLWQQFSCAIRGRGLRNKSQKEKISGTIWKRKKKGVKRSWCRGVKTSAAILSLLAYCASSVDPDTNKFLSAHILIQTRCKKESFNLDNTHKKASFQLSEDVTNLCLLTIWGSEDTWWWIYKITQNIWNVSRDFTQNALL